MTTGKIRAPLKNMTKRQQAEYCEAIVTAHVYFSGQKDSFKKIAVWMKEVNLNLGGLSPERMIRLGRGQKLIAWMNSQLDQNEAFK